MNEGLSFLLRQVPYAVIIIGMFLMYKAIASGNVEHFMKQVYPLLGGLFVILVLSQAMA